MAVKTITVTEKAYETLKARKAASESFSEAIMRIAGKKSLSEFFGILSKEAGEELEHNIKDLRKMRNAAHIKRLRHIVKALGEA